MDIDCALQFRTAIHEIVQVFVLVILHVSSYHLLAGPKPSELYEQFSWKIENFSQISKKELRSNAFEVGGANGKGLFISSSLYILIYLQGCDVYNHLSLFLCVANHDKFLPG
ncbi:hypothetical protein GIB67_040901 [Kingdonia uniflora]|uniref:MATH domain-containing protein n=1 Tax=Kingdonia uniflora TaxID=39325 RepID=A0A7J7L879_9MAGN|nr:hypothetical protein GIB67_040901 [Kingdonia uniflora]